MSSAVHLHYFIAQQGPSNPLGQIHYVTLQCTHSTSPISVSTHHLIITNSYIRHIQLKSNTLTYLSFHKKSKARLSTVPLYGSKSSKGGCN